MPLALGWYHFGCRNFPVGYWSGGSPPSVQVTLVLWHYHCGGEMWWVVWEPGSWLCSTASLLLLMVSGTIVLFDVSLLLLLNSTAVGDGGDLFNTYTASALLPFLTPASPARSNTPTFRRTWCMDRSGVFVHWAEEPFLDYRCPTCKFKRETREFSHSNMMLMSPMFQIKVHDPFLVNIYIRYKVYVQAHLIAFEVQLGHHHSLKELFLFYWITIWFLKGIYFLNKFYILRNNN